MQALMLAAGKGSRLGRYTKDNTKCMLEVNGKTLLERCIDALKEANINKLVLVLWTIHYSVGIMDVLQIM